MRKYYIKATKVDGVSGRDPSYRYTLGQNVHPAPDRKSHEACGEGIHLAKTLEMAKRYVPLAKEFYVAEAGVILGEDEDKVRCASCNLLAVFSVERFEEGKRMFVYLRDKSVLCGREWLEGHMFDISREDIEGQKMEVRSNGNRMTLSLGMKKKDRRFLLKSLATAK